MPTQTSTSPTSLDLATELVRLCSRDIKKPVLIATAESCTAGLISGMITEVAGSSLVFDRGYVTYSNQSKMEMLGVPAQLIETYGAVSEQVACSMALGALQNAGTHIAIAVTGIAGPGGGSSKKPVGLVHFGLARKNHPITHLKMEFGALGRAVVREKTVETALQMAIDRFA